MYKKQNFKLRVQLCKLKTTKLGLLQYVNKIPELNTTE